MINLNCVICGKNLLTNENLRLYKKGAKQLHREGCVIKPKIINGKEYYRNKCYECFEKKFNRKPKSLNNANYDICYLMDVPNIEIAKHRQKANVVTLERLIKSYGEKEGKKRWDEYRAKQAFSNTFEYKHEKHGWTKEQFDEYNKTRAVTSENCIKRYGEEKGKEMFEHYCKKQKYVGCAQEYFIEKYGKRKGKKKYKEINEQKKLTAKNFIRKYGKTEGNRKFEKWLQRTVVSHSKVADELFECLCKKINKKYKIYCYNNNGEFGVWLHEMNTYVKLDFYVFELNKAIEFFGSYWHCDPTIYKENYFHGQKKEFAKQTWKNDAKRLRCLKEEHKMEIFVIWENEYNQNPQQVINNCLKFLGEKYD